MRLEPDQKVIDTGLYGIVRHPMYMATLVLFLSSQQARFVTGQVIKDSGGYAL